MKSTYCLFLTGLILLLLSGCADEDNPGGTGGIVPADISAGIQTRASNTEWDANDAIGITMVKAGTHTIAENTTNRLYKTDASGSGKFTADANQQIYFPQDGTEVNFKSYYPYKDDLAAEHFIQVDVSDQSNLPEIDLMTAEHLTGFSKESPHVSLNFYHRLTKLTFNISVEENSNQYALENASLIIRGMKTTATYDLFNEQLTDVDNPGLIHVPARDDAANRTAIVLPREAGDGVSFTIQFPNGENYTALLKEDLELKAGFHYQFSLQLKKNELVISVSIKDWEDGGTHSNVFIIDTTTTDSEGMEDGDEINIYLKNQSGLFEKISTYTYDENGIWNPDPIVYWSNIPGVSGEFRASMIRQERYNSSQMDEIFTSGNVVVLKNHFARFSLKREVARVVFQLKSTDGAYSKEQLQKMFITLPNYIGGGELINGEFIPGTDTQNILVENGVGDDSKSSIALIQEQTRSANTVAANIYSPDTNMTYQASFNNEITFQAGYSYVLEIDLNLSAVILGVKILPWEDGGKISLTGKVEITGSLEGTDDFFKDKTIYIYNTKDDRINQVENNLYHYSYKYTDVQEPRNYKWEGKTIYWEDADNMKLNVAAAYYPAGKLPNVSPGIGSFSWTIAANQSLGYEDDDLLWCKNRTYQAEPVNLKFEHALSKVIINLTAGDGFSSSDLADVKVTLLNQKLQSLVNILTNTVTAGLLTTEVTLFENIPDSQYSCLIAPQVFSGTNDFISIKLKNYNTPFLGRLGSDFTFVPGQQHVINVSVEQTRIKMSVTVKDWEDGSSGNITIQ